VPLLSRLGGVPLPSAADLDQLIGRILRDMAEELSVAVTDLLAIVAALWRRFVDDIDVRHAAAASPVLLLAPPRSVERPMTIGASAMKD
jgi:hypothetical protein